MANGDDQASLLGEEWETAVSPVPRPRAKLAVLGLSFGALTAVVAWRSHVGSLAVPQATLRRTMSAALLAPTYKDACEGVLATGVVHWPHQFADVNWQGHCSEGNVYECGQRLIEKYVGDYFDAFTGNIAAVHEDEIPKSTQELARWKDRVVEGMQELSKESVSLVHTLTTPEELSAEKICKAIMDERPVVAAPVSTGGEPCTPNYESFRSFAGRLTTTAPDHTDMTTLDDLTFAFPADLGVASNASLESCRRLLKSGSSAADWIDASLAVLDVRACLQQGQGGNKLSRSWVGDCIPQSEAGYPGYVFDFVGAYGVPGEECIPDYGRLGSGRCPSLCENGESLSGHLTRIDTAVRVIHQLDGNKFKDIDDAGHQRAKQTIYNDGPIVGLIQQSLELAACARNYQIIYQTGCANQDWDGTITTGMHSVVVYGWGSEGSTQYYRVVTAFEDADNEVRIAECAIKLFVVPQTKGNAVASATESIARCPRDTGFCPDNAGYTDTEDCDGDGVLDHWCYKAGDSETPTFEAFISSKADCAIVEQSCRRSVLPGRHFGCQRPLGWCMSGENYRRDQDCDGDGHLDHSCDKEGHSGYIASSRDCIDTWEEGPSGTQCDARSKVAGEDASVAYQLVPDYGDCVHHLSQQCVVTHAGWPSSNYPVGACQFHVEWARPVTASTDEVKGCDSPQDSAEAEETLWLEVIQMQIEAPHFNQNGYSYGDRLEVNGVNAMPSVDEFTLRHMPEFIPVEDTDIVKWSTDESVEAGGWLVCLRRKMKIPKVHRAACSEIGEDIWSLYFTVDNPKVVVPVECDLTKCSRSPVSSVTQDQRYSFVRTTNVCDAGWQAAKSNKFDLQFTGPTKDSEAAFEVLI